MRTSVVDQAILACVFASAQVATKLLFLHRNSLTQSAFLVFQFLYEHSGSLNKVAPGPGVAGSAASIFGLRMPGSAQAFLECAKGA